MTKKTAVAKVPTPKWSKLMRQYIVNQLARWASYKAIWVDVTSEQFTVDTTIPHLDPEIFTYNMFRMRCSRIAKHTIAVAHELWQREIGAVRWAEEKARVRGLSELIDKVNKEIDEGNFDVKTTGTMAALIAQLRGLYEQVRKEVSADADRAALSASGTRVLLTNPKNVEIDVDYVSELLMVYREEIGGLHNLDLKSLNVDELEKLRAACTAAIFAKIEAIEETTAEEIKKEETNDE